MRFFDDHWHNRRRLKSTGQALILIVLTFFGMLLFLGLMVDLGQIFLAKGYLRRAADAGALAAAAQFRENRTIGEMTLAAKEVISMNNINPDSITVETCESIWLATATKDPVLCPPSGQMPKKLVRVTIVMNYPLTFLSLLGIEFVPLRETSISEAAAMDVVLVIDVSESMAWKPDPSTVPVPNSGDPDPRDPSVCNPNDCHPMKEAKEAALTFATRLLNRPDPNDEEDRLAIITFATGWQAGARGTQVVMGGGGWTSDLAVATATINSLTVYDPMLSFPNDMVTDPIAHFAPDPVPVSPVRSYDAEGDYEGLRCLRTFVSAPPDTSERDYAISACGTTNIGGGLLLAGNQFAEAKRPDALWVVVLLTDGTANATTLIGQDINITPSDEPVFPIPSDPSIDTLIPNMPIGFCPDGTYIGDSTHVYCQDDDATSFHAPIPLSNYDAADFAWEMAKFVGCPAVVEVPATGCGTTKGQGAVIFTIGLGDEIVRLDPYGVPYGGYLLRLIAELGDDGNPDNPVCPAPTGPADYKKDCGNYYYAQVGTELDPIFDAIYSRIFTRLTA